MRVVHFQRRPRAVANHSVEQSFALVRAALAPRLDVRLAVAPLESRGLLDRWAIARAAAAEPADVLHILGDITFAGAATDPARTVVTVLDCIHETWPNPLKRALMAWGWLRLPARRGVTLAAISPFTAERVAAHTGVPVERITVIPPAVDPRFAAGHGPIPDGDPLVLIVGTTPNKNVARALGALAGLGLRALVVGPLGDAERRAAAQAGVHLEQHDRLDDETLRAAYARAHVVLFPTLYEGFGLPIAEAQAMGRPVVTSDRAPMRDTAGGAAWLVDPLDTASIARGVRDALRAGPERDVRVAAGRVNAERFAPGPIAAQWEALYRGVVRRAEYGGVAR